MTPEALKRGNQLVSELTALADVQGSILLSGGPRVGPDGDLACDGIIRLSFQGVRNLDLEPTVRKAIMDAVGPQMKAVVDQLIADRQKELESL